ncbi:MAG: hypothetical protein ACYC64_16440 [Armatimonadota bacterium]
MNTRKCQLILLLGLTAGLVTVILAPARAATDSELLDLVKAGMLNRYQSIKSFKGSVQQISRTRTPDGELRVEGKIVGAFDGCRVRVSLETTPGQEVKYEGAFDGTDTTEWLKSGLSGEPPVRVYKGLSGLTRSGFSGMLDPRGHGISKVGNNVSNLRVIGRETLNGSECIVVEDDSSTTTDYYVKSKTWVDIENGFTVPRCEVQVISRNTGGVVARQEYVTQIRNYGADTWGPAEYTLTDYGADGLTKKSTTLTYGTDFQINVPISEDSLTLKLASGLEVYDESLDAQYTIP